MINFGMHCHLLLPDLLWTERDLPGIHSNCALPALERLLAKGRRSAAADAATILDDWLCQRFGVQNDHGCPAAPYTLLADGIDPGDSYWLRADPVHLRLEGRRLMLADALALEQTEADALVGSVNVHLSGEGLHLVAARPDRWYLRLPKPPAIETIPLAQARGKGVESLQPRGAEAIAWQGRLNEIQMLLHAHPVNAARESAGSPPVNSLWFWGGGRLAAGVHAPFNAVWSKDAFVAGLAQAARIAGRTLPDSATTLLQTGAGPGIDLIVLDQLSTPAHYGDASGWRAALEQLEHDWFEPMLDALRREHIGMLSLHAMGPAGALAVELARGDLRRFWRRARPLSHYCEPAISKRFAL